MNLDDAADQLYGLTDLDQFASRRGELVKQVRAAGDRESAAAIGKFRKPVLAAALVNQLVRNDPAAIAELTELAGRLRDAHRHLRGEELRALSEQRQRVLAKLTALSRDRADKPVGEPVLNQVRATYEAAIADEAAEQAVLSGRLTAALSYSGFGEVDLSDAVALPPPLRAVPDLPAEPAEPPEPAEPAGSTKPGGSGAASDGRTAAADRALARAERAYAEAQDALDEAVEALDAAREHERELDARIEQVQAELSELRSAAARASRETTAAEREHSRRVRALGRSEEALRVARSDAGS